MFRCIQRYSVSAAGQIISRLLPFSVFVQNVYCMRERERSRHRYMTGIQHLSRSVSFYSDGNSSSSSSSSSIEYMPNVSVTYWGTAHNGSVCVLADSIQGVASGTKGVMAPQSSIEWIFYGENWLCWDVGPEICSESSSFEGDDQEKGRQLFCEKSAPSQLLWPPSSNVKSWLRA